MREWFFIWAFGSLILQSVFLAPFWWLRAHKRRLSIVYGPMQDRTCILSASIAAVALGSLLVNGGRLYGNLQEGLSAILLHREGFAIGAGLACYLFGFLLMVMLADLEVHPPRWTWTRIGLAVIGVWAVASIFIVQYLPRLGFQT